MEFFHKLIPSEHQQFVIVIHQDITSNYRIPFHTITLLSDTVVFLYNLIIIILILIYHKKINKLNILQEIRSQKMVLSKSRKHVAPIQEKADNKENFNEETAENLFKQLEDIMNNEKLFKNPKLDISTLSATLNINYAYLSKIIRYKGYVNFNSYINMHRINYVKNLITNGGLQKFTLMYIYTEAGFLSQATFNRVFKQLEGITPSEFITANNQN